MKFTDKEVQTIEWYDRNAALWASQRKILTEPSFWDEEYIQFKHSKGKLLEIGSGSGREAIEFIRLGYEYTGIDVSKELLKIAQSTEPQGHFFHSSVYDLPFKEKTFDALSSWALLPHIPKERIGSALSSIKRVLKPNAILFFAMREGEGESRESETGRWFSYYSQQEFESILEKQGFQIEKKHRKISRPNLVWLTYFARN